MSQRVVYKYPMPDITVVVPGEHKVVLVGVDPKLDQLCLWVEHTLPIGPQNTQYNIVGTGHSIRDASSHVGSVIDPGGFVWHVYQRVTS